MMNKVFLFAGLLLACAAADSQAQNAAANTWYGDFNAVGVAGRRVTHIRHWNSNSCYFQVANDPALPAIATNRFYFDPTTTWGKNWLSIVETSKFTGQSIEFHSSTAVGAGDPLGFNLDAIGLR